MTVHPFHLPEAGVTLEVGLHTQHNNEMKEHNVAWHLHDHPSSSNSQDRKDIHANVCCKCTEVVRGTLGF